VLGRVVEVVSGQRLDDFFDDRILGPLGMSDTAFHVPPDKRERLALLYMPDAHSRRAVVAAGAGRVAEEPPTALLGGSGLISTIGDYHRFTSMLLGGGSLGDVRLIGPRTLRYMTRNHLPGGHDMVHFGSPVNSETEEGVGFGLGFSVVLDASAGKLLSNEGEFAWGGAASTAFFVDPKEELALIFMTQLLPSSTWPLRRELRQLVYQSLVD
jgi:CubicO group peptidase (beta-lactamase class C family)